MNSPMTIRTLESQRIAGVNLAKASVCGMPALRSSRQIPIVFVVDDEVSVRESLQLLVHAEGWQPIAFASAQEFLDHAKGTGPCCLVLDVFLRGLSGLELQRRVAFEQRHMPIIFMAADADVRTTVQAMKAGAMEFLSKPFQEEALLAAIKEALDRSSRMLSEEAELRELRGRYGSLTPRERQVLTLVVSGRLNKQVGAELGISEVTVKAHRGQAMQKMKADSLADLVKMASRLRVN